jgi:hypothetical protein
MTKFFLGLVTALVFLNTNIMAGGDDRDLGVVESLDEIEPLSDEVLVGEQKGDTLILSDDSSVNDIAIENEIRQFEAELEKEQAASSDKEIIGVTSSGVDITLESHNKCKEEAGLTGYNIEIFKNALKSGSLYNTGPVGEHGTLFSPDRWDIYLDCVENIDS